MKPRLCVLILAALLLRPASARAQPDTGTFGGSNPAFLRFDGALGSYPGAIGSAGIRVLDTDGDGTNEILVGQQTAWYVLGRGASGAWTQRHFHEAPQTSSYYQPVDTIVKLRPGHFDAGGPLEVAVLHQSGLLEFFEAASGDFLGSRATLANPTGMAVGALGGAADQIVVLTQGSLGVYAKGTQSALWTAPGIGGSDVAVGNVDADPALEIVVARGSSSGLPGLVIDAATHDVQWSNPLGFGDFVDLGDVDADGMDEIVALRTNSEIDVYDGDTHDIKWTQSQFYPAYTVRVVDTDGDGIPEVVVTGYTVQVLTGVSGAFRFSLTDYYYTGPAEAGDLGGDCAFAFVYGGGFSSTALVATDVATRDSTVLQIEDGGPMAFAVGPVDGSGRTRLLRSSASSGYYGGGFESLYDVAERRVLWSAPPRYSSGSGSPPLALAREGPGALWYVVNGTTNSGALTAYDAATRMPVWTQTFGAAVVAAGDVDNDGLDEVLAGSGSNVQLLDGQTGTVLWTSPNLSSYVIQVALANVNGVPGAEILAAVSGQGLFAFDGFTHALKWLRSIPKISAFDVGDVDGNGQPDVVIATTDGNLYAYNGITQALVFQSSLGSVPIAAVRVGDVDGDGIKEIAVVVQVDSSTTVLRILKASDRTVIWDSGALPGALQGTSNRLFIGDVDDDGRNEVVVATQSTILIYESPGPPETDPPVWNGPAGVQTVTALGCCSTIQLTWNEAMDAMSPPVSYRVYRSTDAGFVPDPSSLVSQQSATEWRDEALPRATTFHYVVRAVDRLGNEDDNTTMLAASIPDEPHLTQQPLTHATCANAMTSFTVTASGVPPLSYQWLKDGVALQGKTTATLTIPSASVNDEGVYACRVTDGRGTCATAVSESAVLSVVSLRGDVNRDCQVDVQDVFYLLNYLFAGGPAPMGDPDVNGDEVLDIADVFYLINWIFAGGPAPV